jgi:hypothetical protein
MELALILETEGHEGKLYLVDSGPGFSKTMTTKSMESNEDMFQTTLLSTMFTLIAPHEATSAAVSKVHHWINVKSYEYGSLDEWPFECVAVTLPIQIPNSAAGIVITVSCLILL